MRRVFSEFFLDGGKIVFGSLVVGAFLPTVREPIKWHFAGIGLLVAIMLVYFAGLISRGSNQ